MLIEKGWFGLAAARAYIALHPNENILVLESADTCGGTWGEQRIYPGLKSNNLVGRYEYPDLPMDEKTYGVGEREHIPGMVRDPNISSTHHNFLTTQSGAAPLPYRLRKAKRRLRANTLQPHIGIYQPAERRYLDSRGLKQWLT